MPTKLTRVIRLDSLPLNQTYFTEEGYLIDRPIMTSTGIFEYHEENGRVRRELRLPEEVFSAESLASYKGKPVIITHDAGLVDKDNVRKHQIGTILTEGYRSGDDVRAEIIIHDTDDMKSSGLKELSLGYNLDLDETPGVWNGQPYDAIQRNIRINHLALVREARAGDQARLNIDSRDSTTLKGGKAKMNTPKNTKRADSVLSPEELAKAIEQYKAQKAANAATAGDGEGQGGMVPPVKTADPAGGAAPVKDGEEAKPADAPASVEEQVAEIKERNTDADGDMKLLIDIIDTLLAEKAFDEAKAGEATPAAPAAPAAPAVDPAKKAGTDCVTTDGEGCEGNNCDDDDDAIPTTEPGDVKGSTMNADSIDALVKARVSVIRVGDKLNLDGLDTMSLSQAKKAIINAVIPSLRLDGKSDVYIDALYDRAVAEVDSRTEKGVEYQIRQMFNGKTRHDSAEEDSSEARRAAMIAKRQNRNKEGK